MFDKLARELRELEQPREISISVPLDEKGYYDRLCPSTTCGGHFKVLFDDWRDKVAEARAYCPFCRHEADPGEWNTPEQQCHMEQAAQAEMNRLVNQALGKAVRATPPRRIGAGLFDITMKLDFRPGRVPPVIPASAREGLQQDFACEVCGCRYASLGASFFCPACGHNSAVSCFDSTLTTVRSMMERLPSLREKLASETNADVAHDAIRQLIEDQLPRLVGAFERLSEALFDRLQNATQFPRKGNVFQRLDDASNLWQQAAGKSYADFLTAADLTRLKMLFQRRHVLAHRQGIVDQLYIDRSGDQSYRVGQRLVVRESDVAALVELLAKLAAGLRTLV